MIVQKDFNLKLFFDSCKKDVNNNASKITKETESFLQKEDFLNVFKNSIKLVQIKKHTSLSEFFINSNIFYMRDNLLSKSNEDYKPLSFGADPEFILEDESGNIVLMSDKYKNNIPLNKNVVSMKEATIGADYGLLEFRIPYEITIKQFIKNFKAYINLFCDLNKKTEIKLKIKEIEAIEINHKRKQLLEQIDENNSKLDFGNSVASKYKINSMIPKYNTQNLSVALATYQDSTLSAYNYNNFVPQHILNTILTAGGHLHFGGTFIKMLSFLQLQNLIKIFDKEILPKCMELESPAGVLRRKYYGFPGEFRLKEYGFEYRSPSNSIFQLKNIETLEKILNKCKDIILQFRG